MRAGGCQCGAVRYTLSLNKLSAYACHCRDCQRHTASAFALSAPMAADAIQVTGELSVWKRTADSGATTSCYFCPACGTRIYHQSDRSPDQITLKAGTLDDTTDIKPRAHFWVSRKQPWIMLDPDAPAFETQPEDLAAYRRALSGKA